MLQLPGQFGDCFIVQPVAQPVYRGGAFQAYFLNGFQGGVAVGRPGFGFDCGDRVARIFGAQHPAGFWRGAARRCRRCHDNNGAPFAVGLDNRLFRRGLSRGPVLCGGPAIVDDEHDRALPR